MFHGSTDDVIDRVCRETTLSAFCRMLCAILFGTKEHVGMMSTGAAGGSFVERMSLEHKDFICVSWVDAPFLLVKYERSVHLVVAAGCVHVLHETSSFSEAAGLAASSATPSSFLSLWSLRRHFFAGSSRTPPLPTACHLNSWSPRSEVSRSLFSTELHMLLVQSGRQVALSRRRSYKIG